MTTPTFLELPLSALLSRFASNEPTPGGGSASALAGALAASLAQMVSALTVGKKGYEEAESEARAAGAEAGRLGAALQAAIAEDAASFEQVMRAMGLPKASDDEKATRKEAMQSALKGATIAPMGVAQACLEVGGLALRLLSVGNRNASSDAAVAVLLACTGAEGALLNAAINLQSIKDEAWVEEQQETCDGVWESLEALRSDLWPQVRATGLEVPRANARSAS
jgi:formiminotetrahydrofolate cyclodeaminase